MRSRAGKCCLISESEMAAAGVLLSSLDHTLAKFSTDRIRWDLRVKPRQPAERDQ